MISCKLIFKRIHQNPIFITLASFVVIILLQVFFGIIDETFLHISTENPINKYPFKEKMFLGVILAPILETFICQYLSFRLIKIFTKNPIFIIGVSSLFFAANHYYNWLYVFIIFFIGIVLSYHYYSIQKISRYAFWLTVLLHAGNNFVALISS